MSDRIPERPGHPPGLLHVVVLGAYGLIGSAVVRRLRSDGHRVTGVGRSEQAARRVAADAWHFSDIGRMTVEDWRTLLHDVDVVVNASGALQDGARDDLTAIHETALARLAEAVDGTNTRVIQISAAGVSDAASTEFFRSKARGEAALRARKTLAVILRPTLVIAPAAYGGTALLRAAAAIPWATPQILPNCQIACVHVDDLAAVVAEAAEGRFGTHAEFDVTGEGSDSLPDLIGRMRRWLGFPDAAFRLPIPKPILRMTAWGADCLGRLGWRSPLRSTALRVLEDGVRGNPAQLVDAGGTPCRSLDQIFETLPASVQERWFARLYLIFPVIIATLSVFWFLSGAIGLVQFGEATDVLTARGFSATPAAAAVLFGSIVDIALGLAVVWRKWARHALLGMIGVSLAYLFGGTVFAHDLWTDPLGPLVKVLPGMMLAVVALAVIDDR